MEQNELGLYDIYDMPYVPLDWPWFYVFILVAIFLIVALVLYFFSIKKTKELSPTEKAFKKINDLLPERFSTQEQRKQFYFSLSRILKEFLHDQFEFDVVAMTDDELIEYLGQKKAVIGRLEDVKTITSGITFIKFAGIDAAQNKMAQDLNLLKDILIQSKRIGKKELE